jgi:hypothetical protein
LRDGQRQRFANYDRIVDEKHSFFDSFRQSARPFPPALKSPAGAGSHALSSRRGGRGPRA